MLLMSFNSLTNLTSDVDACDMWIEPNHSHDIADSHFCYFLGSLGKEDSFDWRQD